MSDKKTYLTNTFDNSKFTTFGNTLASNGRARVEQTNDGRIYVVIDGVKYSANKYDLFGMNDNPSEWLELFVKSYDKETKKEEFNSPYQKQIDAIEQKMAYNTQKAKECKSIQEKIKKAILDANIALSSFLKECGVHLRSSLTGEKRVHADSLNNQYWAARFNLVSKSNEEYRYLSDNNFLAFDKGKAERQIAFNNITLERGLG